MCKNQLMYVPKKYAVSEADAWEIVSQLGAGFLVVATSQGLRSVFAPVRVDEDHTKLYAHVSRGNSWWSSARDGDMVMGLFHHSDSYVSPNFYPTKAHDPRVAPTWNYLAVEVVGRVTITDDPVVTERVVRELTNKFEANQVDPWTVDDAPKEFVDALVRGIVSFEVAVDAITASAKLSQNQPEINRGAVRSHLEAGTRRSQEVARLMEESK